MPTRSTKLFTLMPAAGVSTVGLTVPAGQTYLVKGVFVFNQAGAADTVHVAFQDPLGHAVYLWFAVAIAAHATLEWAGWAALNPADIAWVQSANGTSNFWMSGTKLPGIA